MTRARFARTSAPIVVCTLFVWGCASEPRAEETPAALRGKVAYLDEVRVSAAPANAPGGNAPLGPPEGRAWVYWSQNVSVD